ncbi:MAG: hypothetical protein PHE51_09835, partial [Eubacteriales bacterium]|nr:hypothetical protein [Eubacteriales bacterium]
MKRLTAIVIVLAILFPCVVFAETRSVTVGAEVSGVYQGTNHWSDATFTFDVTDGMAASFGWLSNGEYSFKYYPASGEIKGGGNKEK